MATNNNGKLGVKTATFGREKEMEAFDSLPKCFRDIINYAPYLLCCSIVKMRNWDADDLREAIERANARNALACYGPDHPQATKEVQ